ncbi:hypothetical protein Xinn_04152 [Xenorhabdus innexi]|uniref:Uncharacterized protein n=1 Tax=Xenorhabdus innexi TaxID=290109 RepID=A0A2G0MIX0_9GAMM|nr:hypothetical protein Xinn_04152 [Xenorhabdus innexi]
MLSQKVFSSQKAKARRFAGLWVFLGIARLKSLRVYSISTSTCSGWIWAHWRTPILAESASLTVMDLM